MGQDEARMGQDGAYVGGYFAHGALELYWVFAKISGILARCARSILLNPGILWFAHLEGGHGVNYACDIL